MTLLYYGDGDGFARCQYRIDVPQLYRAIPFTTGDPDTALDDGAVITPCQRRRLRGLNGRDPDQLPRSAARVRVLERGYIDEETARGSMRSPVSAGSTAAEEAGNGTDRSRANSSTWSSRSRPCW